MSKVDNIISIVMVFVTAIGFSRAASFSTFVTVLVVIAAFILYELVLNAANNNPSIHTVLFVTMGFIFGLSLAVILDFDGGWLSAIICLLCMGYKYMIAEATATGRSNSKNIFVITVNAVFYATMFTIIECMLFRESNVLFTMIYVVSFLFFLLSYISYKRMEPVKKRGVSGINAKEDVSGDWSHIRKRISGYGKQLKEQFNEALDNSGDTFSGLIDELRKRIVPDYSDGIDGNEDIREELDEYRKQINAIAGKEELTENEIDILNRINKEFDEIYYDYYKDGNRPRLEYETDISVLRGDIEMLKNTINIRKMREEEDRQREENVNKRSRAQQARRKREREERERREREEAERRKREEEASGNADEEARAREEAERKRKEAERQRQAKRRAERNRRTGTEGSGRRDSGTGSKASSDSRVAGIETKYFKGCNTADELSLRYKKLCLIYHPDNGNGDVDTYIELKDEYELLKKRLS